MSRATAKRKRQIRQAAKHLNLAMPEMREPINISEAAFVRRQAKKQQASNGPQNLSMAWDDTSLGVGATQTRDGLLDEKERKDTYYKVYLGNQWVSGCVNVISKRITSGGWECVEIEQGKGDPQNKQAIENLLRFENLEEDFLQFLRSIATDLLVFGEAYCELVWQNGVVVGLYMIDAVSMTTHFDKHGIVTKYTQTLERSTETVDFEPEQIVRWWLPDPRAKKKALSPIEHLKDPVYLDQSMITWVEKFFKQGTRPNFMVQLADDTGLEDAQRYVKFYRENYTGLNNAHIPPVFYGGAKGIESGRGTIDIDFDKGQDKQRDRVLAVYGVPPAELNIIESGNIGGGTGESQNKSFIYNTVMPIDQIILEKFNYRVIQKGLGVTDWVIRTRQADYRDDNIISQIEDKGVRNGTLLINEARAARGRKPVDGGDEAVIIAGKDIVPVSRFKNVATEQAQSAQLNIEMQQAQLEKAKQPAPQPQIGSPAQGQDDGQQPPNTKQQQPPDDGEQDNTTQEALLRRHLMLEQAYWHNEYIQESTHTGVMVAFFLKPSEAQQLVLSNGEPIDELHLTLAYLGDSSELGNLDGLKQAVSDFAQNASTFKGVVSGIGRFLAVPDGDPTPVYASVDSPELSEFRQKLVQVLRSADYPPNMQHGYTPHITLSYIPKSAPMPIESVPTIPLNFDTLWLAIGDDRYAFPLDRTEEAYNPNQPRDAHGRWGSGGDSGSNAPTPRSDRNWKQFWNDFDFKSSQKQDSQPASEPSKDENPSVQPDEKSSSSDFPTQDELSQGDWEPLGGDSMHAGDIYKVTTGDNQYFVKGGENVHNEAAAYEAAKAMGADDHILPAKIMDDNGQEVSVSPWLEGKTFAEMSQSERADVMAKMSDEEFTKGFAMQYVLADSDNRNPGNYFVDETGHPRRIDMEMIGQAEDNRTDVSNTLFTLYRAKGLGKSYDELELDRNTLKSIVSHKSAVLHALRSHGVDEYDLEGYEKRIDMLDKLRHGKHLTIGELARIGDSYE